MKVTTPMGLNDGLKTFLLLLESLFILGGSQETTFERLRWEKVEKGEEMWALFESRDEWDLVRWLMKAGVSQSEMENFYNLEWCVPFFLTGCFCFECTL